jgi:hypothetical protein
MKYRSYKVRTFKVDIGGLDDSSITMEEFLRHINERKEKIMHVIPIGQQGVFVNIITLGQDND